MRRSFASRGVITCRRVSGAGRDGWHPGVSGERVAQGGEGADAVLGGGGEVAADGVPARSAAWMRARKASAIWPGQIAEG